jgi:mRNA-degrading endonuclease RelE of RelBE toxin-antitoxin system
MPTRTFEIEYGASAIEDLDSLPEKPRNQILRKIERLQAGLHGNIKRLHEADCTHII